jgi:long-subunit fatty acid transport protein
VPAPPARRTSAVGSAVSFLTAGLLAVAGAGSARAANGPMPSTVGTRGPIAMPMDGDGQTMFRMPSGIGWSLESRIDLDVFIAMTYAEMRNRLNDFDERSFTPGLSGGVVFAPGRPTWEELDEEAADLEAGITPTRKRSPIEDFTFGFGVYVDVAGGGGDADKLRLTTYPETVGVRKGITFITSQLTTAWTPTKWLSIGLGVNLIYAELSLRSLVGGDSTPLGGSPRINGVPIPGNPTYGDFLALFANDGDEDPTTFFKGKLSAIQYSGVLSATLRPGERFALGLSYRERSWAPEPFEGEATIDASKTFSQALGGLDPAIQQLFLATLPNGGARGFIAKYDAEIEKLHVPRQVRLSLAGWPTDRLLLGAEVAWIEWHRAFGSTKVTLEDGDNTDLNFVTGSTSINSDLASRWQNRWIFSAYAAFGITDDVTLRAGASYGKSPFNTKTQEGLPSAGFAALNFSLGAGWRLTDHLELLTLLEYAPPTTAKTGQEAKSLTAKDSKYVSEQAFIHLGLTYRF